MSSSECDGLSAKARGVLASLFVWMIATAVAFPLLTRYWQRDNNGPALAPGVDYRVDFIPDADFRGLDRATGAEYVVPGGRKSYAAGETWQRFRPYYVATPDGDWHLIVLARGSVTPYSLTAVLGVAVPTAVLSLIGLAVCLSARPADSSGKGKSLRPDTRLD